MAVPTKERQVNDCWQSGHWLRHCEGYRVFAAGEPIGYVEEVVIGEDDEPFALEIRVGDLFTHCVTLPIDAVDGIDPTAERLVLAPLADLGSEAFARAHRIPVVI